jgi:hypothetical protein
MWLVLGPLKRANRLILTRNETCEEVCSCSLRSIFPLAEAANRFDQPKCRCKKDASSDIRNNRTLQCHELVSLAQHKRCTSPDDTLGIQATPEMVAQGC